MSGAPGTVRDGLPIPFDKSLADWSRTLDAGKRKARTGTLHALRKVLSKPGDPEAQLARALAMVSDEIARLEDAT